MSERRPPDPPSPFVQHWVRQISIAPAVVAERRRTLDIAMGRGRHTPLLAEGGWRVFGVDRDVDALQHAAAAARKAGYPLRAWCADLTMCPLPRERFELIVVTRYLQRDLFPALRAALTPGGVMIYETFTVDQRKHQRGPTAADHLFAAGRVTRRVQRLRDPVLRRNDRAGGSGAAMREEDGADFLVN
jgi:tellurite methyltransferase